MLNMGDTVLKRSLIYIAIFLLTCVAVWKVSGSVDHFIMSLYMEDIKNELNEVFEANNTLYIDGTMLSIYLYESLEAFELNGVRHKYLDSSIPYKDFKGNTYKVERVQAEDYLKITLDNSQPIFKLRSLIAVDRIMLLKKILVNLVTIMVGILVFILYGKKYPSFIKKKDYGEMSNSNI
jgi:hypothetical protein